MVAWESSNIPKTSYSKGIKVKSFRDDLEDGLYYFRIRAYSESGELLSIEDPQEDERSLRDRSNPDGKKVNESSDVWFWKDPTGTPPPAEPPRNVIVSSFLDAQLSVRFSVIERGEDPFGDALLLREDKTGWATEKGKRTEAIYNIVYDAQTRFTLPISNTLRRIESDTLTRPENLGRWRIVFNDPKPSPDIQPTERRFHDRSQVPQKFLEARSRLFRAIQADRDSLVETVDLSQFDELIIDYGNAYQEWLNNTAVEFTNSKAIDEDGHRPNENVILDIDTVQLEIPNDTLFNDKVYLIAPNSSYTNALASSTFSAC